LIIDATAASVAMQVNFVQSFRLLQISVETTPRTVSIGKHYTK